VLSLAFGACGLAGRMLWWVLETALLGFLLLWRLPTTLGQARAALARELRCDDGHVVQTYGRVRCRRCGAIHSGWLFGRCLACGARPAYISCPTCHTALPNPIP
jgi:hypothetical protein